MWTTIFKFTGFYKVAIVVMLVVDKWQHHIPKHIICKKKGGRENLVTIIPLMYTYCSGSKFSFSYKMVIASHFTCSKITFISIYPNLIQKCIFPSLDCVYINGYFRKNICTSMVTSTRIYVR